MKAARLRVYATLLLSLVVGQLQGACSKAVSRQTFAHHQAAGSNSAKGESKSPRSGSSSKSDGSVTPSAGINSSALKAAVALTNDACNGPSSDADSMPTLRLLTRAEYRNTINDLFSLNSDYGAKLPNENITHGFRNNTQLNQVTDSHLEAFLANAKDISSQIIPKMNQIANCQVSAGESCATQFIATIGPRIWRRPLSTEETTRMTNLYRTGAAFSNEEGMGLVIRAFLSSPFFVYRSEIGKGGALDAYELASALSYFLWATTPDAALLKNAESGALLKEARLIAEANRLLADPRGKAGIIAFMDSYTGYSSVLSVTKDSTKFAGFTSDLRQALAKEAENSMDFWIRKNKSTFGTLFSSDFTVGDPILASFYKSTARKDGDTPILSHSGTSRRGILGMSSVLASLATSTETHPIKRGEFVLSHLLCDVLPAPPNGIEFPAVKPGLSTRERFAAHTAPACAACHKKLDGAGFGMEDYDAVGVFRQVDEGKPVDASGGLFEVDGEDRSFNGVGELSAIIARSQQAKRCFAIQYYQQAQGRFIADRDVCAVRTMVQDFAEKDLSIGELIVKIITNPTYTKRVQQ